MSLQEATTEELLAELKKRGANPICRCHRWQTYLGVWDEDGYTWRCHGCLKSIAKCRC